MGVFSEMDMEQYENGGTEPFQLDSYMAPATELSGRPDPPKQSPQNTPTPPAKVTAENKNGDVPTADPGKDMEAPKSEMSPTGQNAAQVAAANAEQKEIQSIAEMSDEEVMMASARRVSDDTEKITRRNMKDCVSEVIQTKCLDDPAFARLVMHPRKSMVNCFRYITRKAWEYVQDEMKAEGITPGPGAQGYGCDVPDDLCYQWAEEYFRDPNAKEDQVITGAATKSNSSSAAGKTAKKESKATVSKKKPASPSDEGQLTLDFNQLGKAG